MSEHFAEKPTSVADFEFRLRDMPSPEFFELIDHLYWTEQIFETNMKFNMYDDLKYTVTVRSSTHAIIRVQEQINQIIPKEN